MLICLRQQRTLSDCNHSEVSFDLLTRICVRYATAQPDRKQTAATVSLSFSSKDLRNWLKERRELEEQRRTNGGGEQAVVAGKTIIKRKRGSSEQSRPQQHGKCRSTVYKVCGSWDLNGYLEENEPLMLVGGSYGYVCPVVYCKHGCQFH
ncbi:unnamed protein product [Sphagnum compactum]